MTVDVEKMTLPDKIELMEALWKSLSQFPDEVESPGWHRDALAETSERVQSGEEKLLPWEDVKEELQRRLLCDC